MPDDYPEGLDPGEIERFFHSKIPITSAMGVRVTSWDDEGLVLTAPLWANHNHLGTAFGGSLSAVATLAGYGLIWLELGSAEGHVVIRDSAIRFVRPVRGEIRAICRKPEIGALVAFREQFTAEGKARIRLSVTIEEDGEVAVEFEGTFVALGKF
jgi:thioesterase domain-containing protein